MKMEVEIVSKECIKPSSPTPHHLKNHKLSFLDLYNGSAYIPVILYYTLNQDANLPPSDINQIISVRLQLLKKSLSETLCRFYPFAGKIKDTYSIDCNDEGVYFVEAKVKIPLNEFLNHPNLSLITKFLPDEAKWRPSPGNYAAGVQVSTFSCGGIAVGVLVTHMIADGTAFSSFLKAWAATAEKNIAKLVYPKFDASSIFPHTGYPKEVFFTPLATIPVKSGKYIARRFAFDASATANLKEKAATSSEQTPTRVEALTALFGKCIKSALKESSGSDKSFLLVHAVNLRRRARPQFSEYSMGNFVWFLSFLCKDVEKTELQGIVYKLREAGAKLNEDFINSLQGDGGLLNFIEAVKLDRETNYINPVDIIMFSSWCNFGFYDLDFGWGKPAWASMFDFGEVGINANGVVFMDTKDRSGIEAWVSLAEEDMAILEHDKELLAFATIDPSPLK